MQPRVTAILVARNGGEALSRTLAALRSQTRGPDALVAVDAGSSDDSPARLAAEGAGQVVLLGKSALGAAVTAGLNAAEGAQQPEDWLWILTADSEPEPGALGALLAAVEVAPSVAVAGPKLMRADAPDTIARYGESMTSLGASVVVVENELDQAQHDTLIDVLAVSAGGMLVRRSTWTELRGFDPALAAFDAALDFCVRVRLAGSRVVGVPAARIRSGGGPEEFLRPGAPDRVRSRLARTAQLHRRMVYAPFWAVPLHWLSLLPLALLRSVWHLVLKRPEHIGGEFRSALRTAFAFGPVAVARRNLRRKRRVGWGAIAPLRLTGAALRDRRAGADATAEGVGASAVGIARPSLLSAGGIWVVAALAITGLVVFGRLLGAPAIAGGALAPLSGTVGELWTNAAYGWRDVGLGFSGAADPFAFLLAVLGSLTFWSPSTSVVLLYLTSLPLAGLAAWYAASRITVRPWPAVLSAVAWALAPTFLSALAEGRLGAVLAHLLLPWLVAAALGAARSWSAAGTAALLFAGTTAAAPVLAPVLLLAWLALTVARHRQLSRMLVIPVPALVLFLPLLVQQLAEGNPLGLLADPGLPAPYAAAPPWQLAMGMPSEGLGGWTALTDGGLPAGLGLVLALALVAPLVVLAVLAPFSRSQAIAPLLVAIAGLVTAVAATRIAVAVSGSDPVAIWPGTGLSLYWLGLLLAAALALDPVRRVAFAPALATAVTAAALAAPLMVQGIAGAGAVGPSTGRMLPAFVDAEAATDPHVGTLVLRTVDDGIAATVHRGAGTTLDDRSTIASTSRALTAEGARLAELTANLGTQTGFAAGKALEELGLDFVLLEPAVGAEAGESAMRLAATLDASPVLVPVGDTAHGLLWRYTDADQTVQAAPPAEPRGALRVGTLTAGSAALGLALLLAVPTGRRGGRIDQDDDGSPATTFDEDDSV
ncbi:glycosyltransferase [Lysobacter korlensis]|uniref:Glycosyltransferase n=1 Tax=Lysobacter korlensis TaxID=553636 RepID=A0ABV6RYL4_9GAMM